jgi:hypothetical protein
MARRVFVDAGMHRGGALRYSVFTRVIPPFLKKGYFLATPKPTRWYFRFPHD